MTSGEDRGFTIIEIVLFLGITGLLFVALGVGVSINITQQRYIDSARSYKTLLQNQYSATLNVRNADSTVNKCNSDGSVRSGTRDPRGQSSCVILGRAIQVTKNPDTGKSTIIKVSSVTGYDPAGQDTDSNQIDDGIDVANSDDITAFTKYYKPKLATFDSESIDLDWDSYLTTADPAASRHASVAVILVLRAPASGALRVFTSSNPLAGVIDLSSYITAANMSTTLSNCVEAESSGFLPRQLVSVDPRIVGPDGVTLDGGQNGVCQ